jgi:hypothetical protein
MLPGMRTHQWQLTVTDTPHAWLEYSVTEMLWLNRWDRRAEALILSTTARDDLAKVADSFADFIVHSAVGPVDDRQPPLPGFAVRRGTGAHTWRPQRT